MSHGRVNHPSEVVHPGDEITVKVLKFDREKERISLGIRQLTPDPWETLGERFPAGSRVIGRVMSITDYGAFVEIEPGVEGLIHMSGDDVEPPRASSIPASWCMWAIRWRRW